MRRIMSRKAFERGTKTQHLYVVSPTNLQYSRVSVEPRLSQGECFGGSIRSQSQDGTHRSLDRSYGRNNYPYRSLDLRPSLAVYDYNSTDQLQYKIRLPFPELGLYYRHLRRYVYPGWQTLRRRMKGGG